MQLQLPPCGKQVVEELVIFHLDLDDSPLLFGSQRQQVHDDKLVDVLARVLDSAWARCYHHIQAILDQRLGDQVLQLLLEVRSLVLRVEWGCCNEFGMLDDNFALDTTL